MCSARVREDAKYCWNCNADQAKYGPVDWAPAATAKESPPASAAEGKKPLSFDRPVLPKQKNIMTYDSFVQQKCKAAKTDANKLRSKKKQKLQQNEEVTISTGIKNLMTQN